MQFTEKMDQAFRSKHGFGLVDYQNNHDLRMKVETRRDRDHIRSLQAAAKMERLAARS